MGSRAGKILSGAADGLVLCPPIVFLLMAMITAGQAGEIDGLVASTCAEPVAAWAALCGLIAGPILGVIATVLCPE